MRKPNDSLEDYIAKPAAGAATSKPPRQVSLRGTSELGNVRTAGRLGYGRPHGKAAIFASASTAVVSKSDHGRSTAIVLMGVVLMSAILVQIGDEMAGVNVVTDDTASTQSAANEQLPTFDLIAASSPEPVILTDLVARSKRKRARPRIRTTSYRYQRLVAPAQAEEPKFVPTTLVIYSENGVIKRRVEPWLSSS